MSLARLSTLWKEQSINSSPEKKSQLCSALGPLGCFVFGSSNSLEAIKQQHDVTEDEAQFLKELSSDCEEVVSKKQERDGGIETKTQLPRLFLLDVLLTSSEERLMMKVFSGSSGDAKTRRDQLQQLLSLLLSSPQFLQNSTPESLLELFVYLLAVFNNNNNKNKTTSDSAAITLDTLLAAITCCVSNDDDNDEDSVGCILSSSMIVALIRAASNLDQNKQNPVLNSCSSSLSNVFPTIIRLFTEVLSLSSLDNNSNIKDKFLREICAPILSQFGFEFLWRHVSALLQQEQKEFNNNNNNHQKSRSSAAYFTSPIINLIHYCQRLTYSERLQLLFPQALTLQLLPEISTSNFYFGGYGGSSLEGGDNNTVTTTNTLVPSFWMNAFKSLQTVFYPPSLGEQRQRQAHNYTMMHKSSSHNHQNNDDDLLLNNNSSTSDSNNTTALSVLRRYRFAAKVEASSSSSSSSSLNAAWIEVYNLFLQQQQQQQNKKNNSNNNAINNARQQKVPSDILNQMQKILSVSSSNQQQQGQQQTSSFDPLMLATFYFTSPSSVTESGRLWSIEKIFCSSSSSPSSPDNLLFPSSSAVSLLSFSWLLTPLILTGVAVTSFNEEEDNPIKQNLFEAAFVRSMLQRLQTLVVAPRKFSDNNVNFKKKNISEIVNVMKFDTLICGFEETSGNNNREDSSSSEETDLPIISRGASSFRTAFCRYGIIQHEFRNLIRASWSRAHQQITKESSDEKNSSPSNDNNKIQQAHFTVSELFSLLTVVVSRVMSKINSALLFADGGGEFFSSSSIDDVESNPNNHFIVTTLEICKFLSSEWRFAVNAFAKDIINTNNGSNDADKNKIRKEIAGDVSSVKEVCDGCVSRLGADALSGVPLRLLESIKKDLEF